MEIPSEKSVLDWLAGLFETDLGEGHLECFSVQDDGMSTSELIDLIIPFIPITLSWNKKNDDLKENNAQLFLGHLKHLLPPRDSYALSSGLRAPPLFT